MVSPVSVSGSAGAPGKALWGPSVNRVLWGEPAFPGHVVMPTCGAMVLIPARTRKHACSLVPAYTDGISRCLGELVAAWAAVPWGRADRRSSRAMLSRSSSRISTNCRDCIFETSLPGTGGEAFERINGWCCIAFVLLGTGEALGKGLSVADGRLARQGDTVDVGVNVAMWASRLGAVPVL